MTKISEPPHPGGKKWYQRFGVWVAGVVGAALLAVLLGMLARFLGLNPLIADIKPFWARDPFVVNNWGMELGYFNPSGWTLFKELPDPTVVYPDLSALGVNLDHDTPVTLNGDLAFYFDLESLVQTSEVVITGLDFQIERSPAEETADLLLGNPMLGGGGYIQYGLDLSSQRPVSQRQGVATYTASLQGSEGQSYDFIKLAPGESVPILAHVYLGKYPGNYRITPVFHYHYRGQAGDATPFTLRLLYPRYFHPWWQPYEWENFSVRTPGLTVDTQTGRIDYEHPPVHYPAGCLPPDEMIVVQTGMLSQGILDDFIVISPSGDLVLLEGHGADIRSSDPPPPLTWYGNTLILGGYGDSPADYGEQLTRVIAFDAQSMISQVIARGAQAEASRGLFQPNPWPVKQASFANGEWVATITGANEYQNTDLVIRKADGTCQTTLLSLPDANLVSLLPQP